MSYARFSDKGSSVYVYGNAYVLNCVSCRLLPSDEWFDSFVTTSRTTMIKHLQEHRQMRQKVPFSATRRLRREIIADGDYYST